MPVRPYFWVFYFPALIYMSVFVQYSALAVATTVQCELRLGIVMLPALFILFRIFVFPLYFHMDFRVVVLSLWRMSLGFWWELHGTCRWPWECGHFHSIDLANLQSEALLFTFWCLLPGLSLLLCCFVCINFSPFLFRFLPMHLLRRLS